MLDARDGRRRPPPRGRSSRATAPRRWPWTRAAACTSESPATPGPRRRRVSSRSSLRTPGRTPPRLRRAARWRPAPRAPAGHAGRRRWWRPADRRGPSRAGQGRQTARARSAPPAWSAPRGRAARGRRRSSHLRPMWPPLRGTTAAADARRPPRPARGAPLRAAAPLRATCTGTAPCGPGRVRGATRRTRGPRPTPASRAPGRCLPVSASRERPRAWRVLPAPGRSRGHASRGHAPGQPRLPVLAGQSRPVAASVPQPLPGRHSTRGGPPAADPRTSRQAQPSRYQAWYKSRAARAGLENLTSGIKHEASVMTHDASVMTHEA